MQQSIVRRLAAMAALILSSISTTAWAGPYTELGLEIADMNAWATAVEEVIRGPVDYMNPEFGFATFGIEDDLIGEVTLSVGDTLSLGDGGSVTLKFSSGISDGDGVDFAVFENGITNEFGLFAEFGFVDVSSDGIVFAGFDALTVRTTPVAPFEEIDGTDYYNLAGDHPLGLGTGFDLAELTLHPLVLSGDVDLSDIQYVRVVDVIGDGSTFDANSNPIYDPYSTPFAVGGFDLNGIGVIHVPEPEFALSLGFGFLLLLLLPRGGRRRRAREQRNRALLAAGGFCFAFGSGTALAANADLESLVLGPSGFDNGSDFSGGFIDNGVTFVNDYQALPFESWDGFAASNHTDTTTPGFGNQYSSIMGRGAAGSTNYAIGFENSFAGRMPTLYLPETAPLRNISVTNTTYSFLSMRDGDGFAKQFGGASGLEQDWFKLLIEGLDGGDNVTGFVEFYLADFRFANSQDDYIVDGWTIVDLQSLGSVAGLRFSLSSSDVGDFGMNTPAYFALDNVAFIPEPGTAILLAFGLVGLAARRKRTS